MSPTSSPTTWLRTIVHRCKVTHVWDLYDHLLPPEHREIGCGNKNTHTNVLQEKYGPLDKIPGRQKESQEREKCYSWSTKREEANPLCYVDGHVSSWECRFVFRRSMVKDDPGAHAVFTEQGSSASQNDCGKTNGYCEITSMCWTNRRRNISVPPSKNGWRSKVAEKSSLDVHIFGYVFHDTSGQNLGQTSKTKWFLLNEILWGHQFAGLLWERPFEENLWELGRKNRTVNVFLFSENNNCSCRKTWMTPQWLEGTENGSLVESTDEKM